MNNVVTEHKHWLSRASEGTETMSPTTASAGKVPPDKVDLVTASMAQGYREESEGQTAREGSPCS